jgi:simple sugar transport system permease protein
MKTVRTIKTGVGRIEGLPIMMVYFALMGLFIMAAPRVFTGYRIYMSFLQTVPPQLVLALGLTLVITAGEIDLSFSAVIAFSGFVFSYIFLTFGTPWIAFFLALASGALVGFINGLLIAKIGVPSIMCTLASQFFWNGLTILLCGGLSWNIKAIKSHFIHPLFVGRIGGLVPAQSLWSLGLAVLLWFILNRHKFGESILFIGDNPDVARVMGVNVETTKIKLFTLNGLIAGFAAVLLTLEMINFWTTQGAGFLLPVMAAVFIGGTSIAGGQGLIVGSFFGAYIIGSLEAGVVASGIGGYWTRLVSGLVMGASVTLNVVLSETKEKRFIEKLRSSVFVKGFLKQEKQYVHN